MSIWPGLRIKLFADGADLHGMQELYLNPLVRGFTTNPSLMRRAGVTVYEDFAREVLASIPDRPISFEVFADEEADMERQAHRIASWGPNIYVKVPVTNTKGVSTSPLVHRLSSHGVKLNVTALMTLQQVRTVAAALADGSPSFVSVFAGRIADTGQDPVPLMAEAVKILRDAPSAELIWASPREVLNIVQADQVGVQIITATSDILKKIELFGRDLDEYSLETVRMFHRDASDAGYQI